MRLLPVLLGLALLLGAATPALADDGEEEKPEKSKEEGKGKPAEPGRPDEPRGEGRDHAPPVPVGTFDVAPRERSVAGEYVSFTYTDLGVQNFSARGQRLFDLAVTAVPGGEAARVVARGPETLLRTGAFTFKAHDNPGAVAKLETDGTVTFTFGPEATLRLLDDERARFAIGNLTGTLRGDDLAVTGATVQATGDVLVFLDASRGKIDPHRRDIGEAISKRRVGAEASFNKPDGKLEQDVISYGNVTMTTVKAETGNLTVLVEGHGTEGRILVLNVDGRIVAAQKKEDLNILLDNLTIPQADDLADILDPDNDGYTPEYYVVFDTQAEAFQLLVSVPHYSVHTLSVTAIQLLPPPSVVLGIVAGVALLVPSAYVLFRRK